jgi:hypothetical protein
MCFNASLHTLHNHLRGSFLQITYSQFECKAWIMKMMSILKSDEDYEDYEDQ